MNINFFLQSKDFGGAEQFALDLIRALSQKKQTLTIYTSNAQLISKIRQNQYLEIKMLPIYLDFAGNWRGLLKSLFLSPYAIFAYLKLFQQLKQKTDRQIILYSGFSEKILPGALANYYKLPVYFIEYGPLEPIFKKLASIPSLLYLLNKNCAQKIIAPSRHTQLALSKFFPKERLSLIPCGSKAIKLKKTNIQTHLISVVSRLEKGKGQDLLIKAFPLIKNAFPDAQLQIIGQGNFEQELQMMANHDPQIKFLNFIQNKQAILLKSEIIVCPSVWPLEGFGLTIIEAMALAKPIVAFNRSPGNELLIDSHNALLAKDGDHQDLARKIIQLLSDQALQKKLASQARQDFLQHFQISQIADQYLRLLQN